MQLITMESEKLAQVTETLHDQLGRQSITTKTTRIARTADQSLASFYESFVENDNYEDPQSVWTTNLINGTVHDLNLNCGGFPYKQTVFEKNPSGDKTAIGLPGKAFSVNGPHSKKFRSETDLSFMKNLFPPSQGFTMYETVNENGSREVKVFDASDKNVAAYVRVPGFDHILSISEYDANGRIVKKLPPAYHEKISTFTLVNPWPFGDEYLSVEEKAFQRIYGTFYEYDGDGNLTKKSTPDSGTVEYFYNEDGNLRFMNLSSGQIIYFTYDDAQQLIETGYLVDSVESLDLLAKQKDLPDGIARVISQDFS